MREAKQILKMTRRSVRSNTGRYLALLLIVLLSVGFFSGLKVTKPAMQSVLKTYLDRQKLYDFRLLSRTGFPEADAAALNNLDGIDDAEGKSKEKDDAGDQEEQIPSGLSDSGKLPATDEEVQKQKEEQDQGLKQFRQSFHPEISEAYSGVQEAFIGDRAAEFDHAIADHFYQAYGDLYTVTKVELKEMLDETDDEIRCMVRVYTKSGEKNYSQDYIVVYSKAYDFYSVYAYNR